MKPAIGFISLAALLAASGAYAQDESAPAADTAAPVAETPAATEVAETVTEETVATEVGYRLPGGFLTRDYLGILGTYNLPDSGRDVTPADVKRATGIDIIYGHQLDKPNWGYEIHGFSETFETGTALRTDFYRYGLGGDVTYAFGDRSDFTPFVLGGGGLSYNDIYPDASQKDGFDWFLNVGAGFVTKPLTGIGFLRLRGEARYVYDNFADAYGDIKIGLGVEIPLLRSSTLEPVVAKETKVVEVEKIVEVPTGVLDTDGDGVVDEKDKCPDTPAGTRVDGDGCPLSKVIALDGVTFEFNQARLRPDAQTILDTASDILKKYPDMKVEVAGHTDNIGDDAYNQRLSEARAGAVRDYFVEKQIPADQMTVKGYGEAEPVADNATDEGRERNRRVELRILN